MGLIENASCQGRKISRRQRRSGCNIVFDVIKMARQSRINHGKTSFDSCNIMIHNDTLRTVLCHQSNLTFGSMRMIAHVLSSSPDFGQVSNSARKSW